MGLILPSFPVIAQDTSNVTDLQRIIELQQKQLEAQQRQLDEQRQLLKDLQTRVKSLGSEKIPAEAVETTTDEAPTQKQSVTADEAPPQKQPVAAVKPRPRKSAGIAQAEKRDSESPTGSNVSYFDPRKTINIPGTDTDISIHGFVEFQMIHDSDGLDNNRFDTATIPVDGAPSQTKFSVNPSQLRIASHTPVTQGRANTVLSIDFNDSVDRPEPRLRIAYGEYVNDEHGYGVLAGQTYSTMLDLRAAPETLDFAGPAGMWQTRQPLFRFTWALSEGFITEVSIETPENANYINATRQTRWPDFSVAGTWTVNGEYLKHFRLSALARDLRAESDIGVEDSEPGWAVAGSAKFGLPILGEKDNLKINMHYGDGYGTQIKGGPREGVFDPAGTDLETIEFYGAYGGIQHFWSDMIRSNLVYGFVDADNPDFVSGDTFESTQYFAIDLIWNPFERTEVGAEYLWGELEEENGADGDANRFLLHFKNGF